MNLQGKRVKVDGVEATVESSWGQGAHRAFKLSDGRVVLDLTDAALVKVEPKVEVKRGPGPDGPPKAGRQWDWLPKDGHHDLEE